jgi:hypothetical protein
MFEQYLPESFNIKNEERGKGRIIMTEQTHIRGWERNMGERRGGGKGTKTKCNK